MAQFLQAKSSISLPLSSSTSLPPAPPANSKVELIDKNRVMCVTGNSIRTFGIFGTSSSTEVPDNFVFAPTDRGVSAFAFSRKAKRLAYSPRRLNPSITIQYYPEEEGCSRATLENGTELEYVSTVREVPRFVWYQRFVACSYKFPQILCICPPSTSICICS